MRPGVRQILCLIYVVSFWGWSGAAFATAWQEHRDAGLKAFDTGDFSQAVSQFDTAVFFANESGAAAEDLGLLLEHLATAYLADKQYRQSQETIALWDRVMAENQDQAWAADHRVVRDRLAAFAAKSMDQAGADNGSSSAVAPPQPSGEGIAPQTPSQTYAIHLASAKSESSAQTIWDNLIERHPLLLEGKRLELKEIDLGDRGVFFRIVAFPFAGAADARSACAQFQEKDQYCVVIPTEQATLPSQE